MEIWEMMQQTSRTVMEKNRVKSTNIICDYKSSKVCLHFCLLHPQTRWSEALFLMTRSLLFKEEQEESLTELL